MSRRYDFILAGVVAACVLVAAVGGKRLAEIAVSAIALAVLGWTAFVLRRAWSARDCVTLGTTDVVYRRIAAHILDWIFPGAPWLAVQWLSFEIAWRTGIAADDYQRFIGHQASVLVLLWLANFVLLQAATGYTVGKALLGIRCVDEHGRKPGLRRTVIRTVPLLVEQFGLVALFAMARSPMHQRYGDRFAHTLVVRA